MAYARGGATRPDGSGYTSAVAGAFEITRLVFPPSFRHGDVDPERGYLVVVLAGSVRKSFVEGSTTLSRGSFATVPAGAKHSSCFADGTQVLAVRATDDAGGALFGSLLTRRTHVRATMSTELGWRIAGELEARDASSELALEGLVLQLLAAAGRGCVASTREGTSWLPAAREVLRDRTPQHPSLSELAELIGRHPTHVARAFRREYGVTVTEYARSLRLEWARTQIVLDAAPLARIAYEAGFADQSHFTRAFRRHTGVTPGRYRELVRS
jgi:AraC family transcriptional regulator